MQPSIRSDSSQRLLIIACVGLTAAGLWFSITGYPSKKTHWNSLAMEVPTAAAAQAQPVKMVRLPGKDGSASIASATAKTADSVAAIAVASGMGGDARSIGRSMNAVVFGDGHWSALEQLWSRESGWNPSARNRWSGACGIPQAMPCSKITDMSTQGQISWGLNYIKWRYGNPTVAWNFWQSHGWY